MDQADFDDVNSKWNYEETPISYVDDGRHMADVKVFSGLKKRRFQHDTVELKNKYPFL